MFKQTNEFFYLETGPNLFNKTVLIDECFKNIKKQQPLCLFSEMKEPMKLVRAIYLFHKIGDPDV